tara:strand:+ start:1008 stop:2006 length:999 start_codon:yes stop_codon:yes gene_type:complete
MTNKTFLVLGSNSFSGSNLIYELLHDNQNNKVIGISRSKENKSYFLKYKKSDNLRNFKFFQCNLKRTSQILKLVDKFKPNYIINYSALGMVHESWLNPEDWFQTNLIDQTSFYKNLIGKKFIKKIIHVSTPEVYGSTSRNLKENYKFNPSTPYAISRAAMDIQLKRMYEYFGLPIILTRTANVYGPGQQLYRIIPKTILSFKKKEKIQIHGDGKSQRSFIYINDASSATVKILKKGKIGETFHISSANNLSIIKLVKKISQIMKINFNRYVEFTKDRIGKDQIYDLNSNKLVKQLKWHPRVNLNDGIIDTINWVNENFINFKKIKTEYRHKK